MDKSRSLVVILLLGLIVLCIFVLQEELTLTGLWSLPSSDNTRGGLSEQYVTRKLSSRMVYSPQYKLLRERKEEREREQRERKQGEGKQGEGKQGEGKQGEGKQREGKQGEGEQGEGKQGEGKQGEGDQGVSNYSVPLRPKWADPRCGIWQEAYTNLHASILAKPYMEQKLVVVRYWRNGLADRLSYLPSIFLMGLLTDRALKIQWVRPGRFEDVYQSPAINWTWTFDDDKADDPNITVINDYMTYRVGFDDHPIAFEFGKHDLRTVHPEKRTIVYAANQGQLHRLFDNPYHKDRLFALGLRPDNAYGCVINYLLEPTEATLQAVAPVRDVLSPPQRSKQMVIGLQIRYGDSVFDGKNENNCYDNPYALAQNFFDCAKEIEESHKGLDGDPFNRFPALWYLITDCPTLRTNVTTKFGKKVLTLPPLMQAVNHLEKSDTLQFMVAVGENWLFGETDFQIITELSAYGRTGALRGMKWHSVYSLRTEPKSCGPKSYDTYETLSEQWVRIR